MIKITCILFPNTQMRSKDIYIDLFIPSESNQMSSWRIIPTHGSYWFAMLIPTEPFTSSKSNQINSWRILTNLSQWFVWSCFAWVKVSPARSDTMMPDVPISLVLEWHYMILVILCTRTGMPFKPEIWALHFPFSSIIIHYNYRNMTILSSGVAFFSIAFM